MRTSNYSHQIHCRHRPAGCEPWKRSPSEAINFLTITDSVLLLSVREVGSSFDRPDFLIAKWVAVSLESSPQVDSLAEWTETSSQQASHR